MLAVVIYKIRKIEIYPETLPLNKIPFSIIKMVVSKTKIILIDQTIFNKTNLLTISNSSSKDLRVFRIKTKTINKVCLIGFNSFNNQISLAKVNNNLIASKANKTNNLEEHYKLSF